MTVCFISHSARIGGAELALLETIEVLQETGVRCYAVLPARGPLLTELAKLRVPVLVTSYALWMSRHKLSFLAQARALLNIVAKAVLIAWKAWRWNCDIIYTNTTTVCVGALAAALLGRPHVWHLHEFGPPAGLNFIFGSAWSSRLMNRLSSLVIAPSQAVAREFRRRLPRPPLCVVYGSMHRALRPGPAAASPETHLYRCLMAGAIAENKHQEDALLALAELRQRRIAAELLVLGEGDGDYRARLQNLVVRHHLSGRVGFLGQLPDPRPQLRAADVVLVCSLAEGFGRTTVEAMLAGKPVIGADNTATAELIHHGSNGLLFHTADPLDLADRIDYLYRHPDLAARLGRNAQAWAMRAFTRDRYRDQIVPLLAGLLTPAARLAS